MRVAIIGLGGAGSVHLQALDQVPSIQVVGVHDPAEAAIKRAKDAGLPTYATVEELLKDAAPDVVTISSPPLNHVELTQQGLEANAHVLCEKPLAITSSEALEMVRTAGRTNRQLMLATKFRHVDDIIDARKLIADGAIGTPVSFAISFCSSVDMASRWNSKREVAGGGVVIDNGCHAFDIVSFVFGGISQVRAASLRPVQDIEVEDSALLQVHAAKEVLGTIELSWSYFTGRDPYLSIQGTDGAIEVGWKHARVRGKDGVWAEFGGERYNKFSSHRRMYESLADLIVNGGAPWISTVDALRTVAAVEAAYRSLETGGWERVEVKDFGEQAAGARMRA